MGSLQKLARGSFFGSSVRSRTIEGFVFTEYSYPPVEKVRRHSHESAYFSFVLHGFYDEYVASKATSCTKGFGIFHPADEIHSDRFGTRRTRIFSVEIPKNRIAGLQEYDITANSRNILTSPHVLSLAHRAYRSFYAWDAASALMLEATAIELLHELPWQSRAVESRVPHWMNQAIELIHAEYRTHLTCASIARRVDVHPVHLARTFKRNCKTTIREYISRLRIEYSVKALGDRTRSLAEIAADAGFADQSHFGRTFRTIIGETPRAHRGRSRS